ncbi:MAG TPA: ROK family transcriptional regulator [Streptosporangiaceae bacterium]|nr:ROK family transcriptional regulator [Streptosporangiaceae bacterium]
MKNVPALRPSDRQLLATLREHGELERSELARLSGLPRSTIADALARLERFGVVAERTRPARSRPRPGRPPRLMALAAPAGLVGVLALTHGTLQAGVVGFDGTLHARQAASTKAESLAGGMVEPGLALLDQALRDASATRESLACAVVGLPMSIGGLGVQVPALASSDQPRLRHRLLPAWGRADPAVEVRERLGRPAWVENDANLGALGEGAFGAAVGMSSFIYIKIVQGVGAGVVIDRRLHHGAAGLAGELAHIHVQDDGVLCSCGGRGCLMTTQNTRRLVELIRELHPGALTMEDVLAIAMDGDAGVWRVLRDLGRTIGRSLADFCVYVAPDGIILDGILRHASAPVIEGIREMLAEFAPPAVAAHVRVVVGELDNRAELRGAVVLARGNLFGRDIF